MNDPGIEVVTADRIDELLQYLPALESLTGDGIVGWTGGMATDGGRSITLPEPQYLSIVEEFFGATSDLCWQDWDYLADPSILPPSIEAIAEADLSLLRKYLTWCTRGERLCEGHWGSCIKSGKVVAILRRLAEIRGQTMTHRRSRKHVLDWVSRDPRDFLDSLNCLLEPTGARVTDSDLWMPKGYGSDQEARLDDLDDRWLSGDVRAALRAWWLDHPEHANTPNWDFLASCHIGDRKGLVLVEAKAHASELPADGKALSKNASENSRRNHDRVAQAIADANSGMNAGSWVGFNISRDRHYQLSNRIAFGWKLAQLGVPTVLMYLGFIGDSGIPASARPFMTNSEWRENMLEYTKEILPSDFVTLAIRDQAAVLHDGLPFAFVIRSMPILSPTV